MHLHHTGQRPASVADHRERLKDHYHSVAKFDWFVAASIADEALRPVKNCIGDLPMNKLILLLIENSISGKYEDQSFLLLLTR